MLTFGNGEELGASGRRGSGEEKGGAEGRRGRAAGDLSDGGAAGADAAAQSHPPASSPLLGFGELDALGPEGTAYGTSRDVRGW
jgi:hypothetical protein